MDYCVLIVDDEKMPREILRGHLPWGNLGITRVLSAEDGLNALDIVKKEHPDIIISDMKMPRMNGLELAEAVREIYPECQFVFLSGYSDKEYLKGAIKLRAASYVEKPINLEEIEGVLQEIVAELNSKIPPNPADVFFQGIENTGELADGSAYKLDKTLLRTITKHIRHKERTQTEELLNNLMNDWRRSTGSDPEVIRHCYRQIIFIYLSSAESRNIAGFQEGREHLLYTAANGKTLAELCEALKHATQLYFDSIEPSLESPAQRVDRYIEAHYTRLDFTVQAMAYDLGFVNTYLCMAYKKECGKTINQRLTEVRVERAAEMLRSSNEKLYKIANAVGYADGKYFTKVFTRTMGLSPNEYRERHYYET